MTTQQLKSTATTQRGMFMVMLAAVLWGTVGIASNILYTIAATNPISLSCFRLLIAAPLLLFVAFRQLGWQMFNISRRDLCLMIVIGVLIAAYQALFFMAIPYAGVTISSLVTICTMPVLIAITTGILERKLMNQTTLFATACALVGTFLLLGTPSTDQTSQQDLLIGVAFAFGSACGYVGVMLLGKSLASRIQPLQVTSIGFTTGAILLLIVAQINGLAVSYTAPGWLLILYLGVFPTACAYALFMIGMRSTPAVVASVVVLLEPLVAVMLAWLIFGEQLTPLGLIGGGLLLTAIYILSRSEQ